MSIFRRKNKSVDADSDFYDVYRDARDAVWKLLAENEVSTLPIDVFALCETQQIECYSFVHAQVLIQSLHIEKHCVSGRYLVLCPAGRRIILYDDAVPHELQRFLVASALAHIVLEHTQNRTELPVVFSPEEMLTAGVFATRLLAPLSVLWGMGVDGVQELIKVCRIPRATAEKRFERLCEINDRNDRFGMASGQGSMFLSGYERSAYRNFSPFIENYRKNRNR